MIQCLNIKIEGNVFKTGYRYFLKQKAFLHHISGYVYYKSDNSIGVLAQGKPETLDSFLHYCWRGNKDTTVEAVQFKNTPLISTDTFEVIDEDEIASISIKYTDENNIKTML